MPKNLPCSTAREKKSALVNSAHKKYAITNGNVFKKIPSKNKIAERLKIFSKFIARRLIEIATDIPIAKTNPGNAKSAIVKPSQGACSST